MGRTPRWPLLRVACSCFARGVSIFFFFPLGQSECDPRLQHGRLCGSGQVIGNGERPGEVQAVSRQRERLETVLVQLPCSEVLAIVPRISILLANSRPSCETLGSLTPVWSSYVERDDSNSAQAAKCKSILYCLRAARERSESALSEYGPLGEFPGRYCTMKGVFTFSNDT